MFRESLNFVHSISLPIDFLLSQRSLQLSFKLNNNEYIILHGITKPYLMFEKYTFFCIDVIIILASYLFSRLKNSSLYVNNNGVVKQFTNMLP